MTEQVREKIIYEGEQESLLETPLEDYLELIESDIYFQSNATTCSRGYCGTWEILKDRIYLIDFSARSATNGEHVTLETLFPGFPNRVFAHWIRGILRIPQGRRVNYQYEKIITFNVVDGVIKSIEIIKRKEEIV